MIRPIEREFCALVILVADERLSRAKNRAKQAEARLAEAEGSESPEVIHDLSAAAIRAQREMVAASDICELALLHFGSGLIRKVGFDRSTSGGAE